jgi:hypothetical protein
VLAIEFEHCREYHAEALPFVIKPLLTLDFGVPKMRLVCPSVKVIFKRYRIQRASASACMLCPFPEYSPVFQNTISIVSKDLDGYRSISEGSDDYHMISRCRDKYCLPIQR